MRKIIIYGIAIPYIRPKYFLSEGKKGINIIDITTDKTEIKIENLTFLSAFFSYIYEVWINFIVSSENEITHNNTIHSLV